MQLRALERNDLVEVFGFISLLVVEPSFVILLDIEVDGVDRPARSNVFPYVDRK